MARRSFSNIVSYMIAFLRSLRPNVDTKPGTFTRDVVIDAPANEFAILYRSIENVSNSQSPDLAFSQALDRLARNLQTQRRGAQKALGHVTFYRIVAPSGDVSIPRGTAVSSKGSVQEAPRQYVTVQDTTLSVASFDPTTGRFEVTVPIRASAGGAAGNVPAGTITALVDPLPNIAGCYNSSPTQAGSDRESDTDLSTRVKALITGNNVGTSPGYFSGILSHPSVSDVYVVGPEDTTIAKRAYAGSIDILVRGLIPTQPTIERYVYVTGTVYYIPTKQPLNVLSSGSFVLQGTTTGILVEGTHYNTVQDTAVFGGSINAIDKFEFVAGMLTLGETITFTYTYNSLIEDLQNQVNAPLIKIATADVLVKAARARQVDVTATIEILPGYTATGVATDVRNAVINFLNSFLIGQEVQQSDVINVIVDVVGVDDVLVPLTTLEENPETGSLTQDSDGNLPIPVDSYATAGDVTIYVKS